MTTVAFAKYEALGNDYLVIDPTRTDLALDAARVALLCDRHRGVGGDGVLFGPFFEAGAIRLRIFNADGSECEKSGNGLRMFARYLRDAEHVTADRFAVRTLAGEVAAEVVDLDAGVFTIAMGGYTHRRAQLEAGGASLEVSCVDVGNPHCVIFGGEVSRDRALRLGPEVSRHAMFPRGTNVQLAEVRDRRTIDAEVWERGSGYTLASGSSACAIACAARELGLVEPAVTVHMPGGRLSIEITPAREILLTGEARAVATGTLAPGLVRRLLALS